MSEVSRLLIADGGAGKLSGGGVDVFTGKYISSDYFNQDAGIILDPVHSIFAARERADGVVESDELNRALDVFQGAFTDLDARVGLFSEDFEGRDHDHVCVQVIPGGVRSLQYGEGVFYFFTYSAEDCAMPVLTHVSTNSKPVCRGLTEFCFSGGDLAVNVDHVLMGLNVKDRKKLVAYVESLDQPEVWQIDEIMRIFSSRERYPRVNSRQQRRFQYDLPEDVSQAVVYYVGSGLSTFLTAYDLRLLLAETGWDFDTLVDFVARKFAPTWWGLKTDNGGQAVRFAVDGESSISAVPPKNNPTCGYSNSFVLASFSISSGGVTNHW